MDPDRGPPTSASPEAPPTRAHPVWPALVVAAPVALVAAWILPALLDPSDPLLAPVQAGVILVGTALAALAGLHGVHRDRERQSTVIAELQAKTDDFLRAQRVAGVGHWDYDIENDDLTWSDEVYRIVGVSPETFDHTHKGFFDFVHPDDRDELNYLRSRALAGIEPLNVVHRIVRPSGEIRWVHERGALSEGSIAGPGRIMGTVQDVTDLHRAEREATEAHRKLSVALARVQEAREEERRKLSREIHDDIAATLSGLLMSVSLLRRDLTHGADPEQRLDQMEQDLRDIVADVRALARKIRPVPLDDLGLGEALKVLAEEWRERTDARIEVQVEPGVAGKLTTDRGIQLYRICQEAVNNALKHADPDRIRITLGEDSGAWFLRVEDDGSGFDPSSIPDDTLGLLTLRERARSVGASLSLESGASGTRVEVRPDASRTG